MKNMRKQHSVIPVYVVALLWAVGGFGFRIHTVVQILLFVVLSAVILVAGEFIFKGSTVVEKRNEAPDEEFDEELEEAPEEVYQAPVKPQTRPEPLLREDTEIAALRAERDRAVSEMRRLNHHIADMVVSRQIDRMESTTDQIFAFVAREPDKKAHVRRFLNYYLPTTIKLLGTYDRLTDTAASVTNVDGAKKKIGDLMTTIVQSFDHLLDALRRGEDLDINAEIQVLYRVLNEGGHGQRNNGKSSDGTRK